MAGKFVIITAKNGEFTFNLKASNGEVILTASSSGSQWKCLKIRVWGFELT